MMATVVERTEGRYEVQEVEFGKVYRWCPECIVIECDCGESPTLNRSMTACECGADYAATVQELVSLRSNEEALHPWRYAEDREDIGISC